jgi:hypothetical protein
MCYLRSQASCLLLIFQDIFRRLAEKYFSFLAIHVGWTSENLIVGIALCLMVATSLRLAFSGISWARILAIGSASITWAILLHFAFNLSTYSRIHVYNLFSLVLAFLVFLQVALGP